VPYKKTYRDAEDLIANSDLLWRYLNENQITYDHNLGHERPSSSAFSDSSDGTAMSVSIVKLRQSPSVKELLDGAREGLAAAEFKAGDARALNQGVDHTPDEGDTAHGSVWDKTGNRSKGTRTRLAKKCKVLKGRGD
jgi:hypothetical protein